MGTPAPAQKVRAVIEPAVRAAGLVLEDVVVAAAGRRTVVRIVLDLDDDAIGSLDLDTVGEVSREISAALDAAEPVRGAYTLEVSTPGTDRPLTELRHFRRARTRLVRLVLKDGAVLEGRLVEADADAYVLRDSEGGERSVDPATVLRGHVEVELTRGHDDEEEQD
ncbi:ribosome maturation factor RimP [Actinotalea sp.]|uniref:ribosome maturation factor RimP n=1 Tax=Actinotalea sp. TaxID=1872145 RepID=UPI0035669CCF